MTRFRRREAVCLTGAVHFKPQSAVDEGDGIVINPMPETLPLPSLEAIVAKARELGADLAGITQLTLVRESPSHRVHDIITPCSDVGTPGFIEGGDTGILWPEAGYSVIVLAVAHPENRPELDWWRPGYTGGTAGNRQLMAIADGLARWLKEHAGIESHPLPYHIERGGLYLKDMAALAGLGRIGKNNMLVTPQFGPRVRLRGLITTADLPTTECPAFDPCTDCPMACRTACPVDAFAETAHTIEQLGTAELPAQDGTYDRRRCSRQMEQDRAGAEKNRGGSRPVRFCRLCEWACPVGTEDP